MVARDGDLIVFWRKRRRRTFIYRLCHMFLPHNGSEHQQPQLVVVQFIYGIPYSSIRSQERRRGDEEVEREAPSFNAWRLEKTEKGAFRREDLHTVSTLRPTRLLNGENIPIIDNQAW